MKHTIPGQGRAGLAREDETNLNAILPCFWRLIRGAISDVARYTGRYCSGCDYGAARRMLVFGFRRARGRANRRDFG